MAQPRKLISGHKELEATGKAEPLVEDSTEVVSVLVKAVKTNKALINIGPSTINSEGYELEAGESVEFDFVDLNQIFLFGKELDEVLFLGIAQ